MDINTNENEMISQTVDDAALTAARPSQASQLAIGVVESIRADMAFDFIVDECHRSFPSNENCHR